MFQSATPRVQELGFLGEPLTVTTSPGRASLKNHLAFSVDMLTQPWDTLARPWEPTDQGAVRAVLPPQGAGAGVDARQADAERDPLAGGPEPLRPEVDLPAAEPAPGALDPAGGPHLE